MKKYAVLGFVVALGLAWGSALPAHAVDKLFWTEPSAGDVLSVPLAGGSGEIVWEDQGAPEQLAADIDGSMLYWTDPGNGRIVRAKMDGTGPANIIEGGLTAVGDIAVDAWNEYVFYVSEVDSGGVQSRIWRADMMVTDSDAIVEQEGSGTIGPIALDTTARQVYFVDVPDLMIYRQPYNSLPTQFPTPIHAFDVDTVGGIVGIVADAAAGELVVGVIQSGSFALHRMGLDGENPRLWLRPNPKPGLPYVGSDFAMDWVAGHLYVVSVSSLSFYSLDRFDLEGTNFMVIPSFGASEKAGLTLVGTAGIEVPADTDEDGIPDSVEGTDDRDRDGLPNHMDADSDADGLPDSAEGAVDADGDGVPNFLDTDADGDGVPDAYDRETPGLPLYTLGIVGAVLLAGAVARGKVRA